MSRLQQLFKQKSQRVLNVYTTAGYPSLESTLSVMVALEESGVDIIELGMPYSDPLADGPVIQASSSIAIANGMSIKVLFAQLAEMRNRVSVPVILMGYLNPILQYGFEAFCRDAAAVGVDGLILPDIPVYEFETEYAAITRKYGLDFIFLVTPETKEDRIRQIDRLSSGFIYAVSSSSTTGTDKDFNDVTTYLQKLSDLQLQNPILVGFGIKDKATFDAACAQANGAIIGSAFIQTLTGKEDIVDATRQFVQQVLH